MSREKQQDDERDVKAHSGPDSITGGVILAQVQNS